MDHLLAEAKPKDWQRKFINSLIDRDLLELVPHIHKSFSNMRHAAVNSHHVTIFTPEKLQPFQHDNLRNYLKERFNIKTRSITAVIDRDMLSGVKIKAGPKTIDQSRRR
jgi:F0F1-type ATP synthase delta subunit